MRIGMILDHYFPPDIRVEKEAISLTKAGHEVYLLCFRRKDERQSEILYKGIHLIKISVSETIIKKLRALTNTILNIYPYYWAFYILRFIKKYRIEVLHIHDLYMLPAGFVANHRLKNRLPIVGDLHENYADALPFYRFSSTFPGNLLISYKKWKSTEQKLISKLDYIIAVAEEMKQRIETFTSRQDNIYVVDNAEEIDDFLNYREDETILNRYPDKFIISYLGGIDYHRGIDTVIEALVYLKHIDNLVFLLIGEVKNIARISKKINDLNLSHKIIFEGYSPRGEYQNYFRISDIGIIPHLKTVHTDNTSPNKLYQYMLMGVPVIASNCNSIQNIIEPNNAGLIFESGNAKDLAEKVNYLYNHPDQRKKLGDNGINTIRTKYNWQLNAEKLKELYKRVERESR